MLKFYSLVSGSSGNAALVSDGKTHILIDCGLTGKRLAQGMEQVGICPNELHGILITHEHGDHISGAGVVSRRHDVPIYANAATWSAMEGNLGKISSENICLFEPESSFEIGTFGVLPFSIPHDAASGVGYNIFSGSIKVSVATDMGCIQRSVVEHLKGSAAVILEANHDVVMLEQGSYPHYLKKRILSKNGHLSNECAGEVAAELVRSGTANILLGHLSSENNLPEVAYRAVHSALKAIGAKVGSDVKLGVASRYEVTCAV